MTACELFANCIRHGLLNFELCIQLHLPLMAYRQMFVVGADPDIWDFVQLSEYLWPHVDNKASSEGIMLLERPDIEGAELLLSGGAAACHSLSLHAKLPPRSQDGKSDQAMEDKDITRCIESGPWDEGIVPSALTWI
jgi:hypothetical protein